MRSPASSFGPPLVTLALTIALAVADPRGNELPVLLPPVFGPVSVGETVVLPVTHNALYSTPSGTWANGDPITVATAPTEPPARRPRP